MTSVEIMQQNQFAALVEWRDDKGVHRAYIPITDLDASRSQADEEALRAGIPYGELWETLALGQVGSEAIATALRNRNIWTLQDVRTHVGEVKAAIQEAYSADLKYLLELARPHST